MPARATSINSYNSTSRNLYLKFIAPSPLQALVYLLTGGLLLVLIKARAIWDHLGGSIIIKDTPRGGLDTPASNNVWGDISTSVLPQVFFWGAIGMVMYAILWFLWNIVTNLRNDMTADDFVHPKQYDRKKYWRTILARKVFFGSVATLYLVYIFALFKFMPVLADAAYGDTRAFSFPASLVALSIYLFIAGLLVHIFVLVTRLLAHSWQTIYRDL